MNTLQIIKKQIKKMHLLFMTHRSLSPVIVVLSVTYTRKVTEAHGTFCYRGQTYRK